MDEQIKTLLSLRADLRRLLKNWDQRLRHTPPGQPARLLDTLPGISAITAPPKASKFSHKKGKSS
jgi:hypothetical protein